MRHLLLLVLVSAALVGPAAALEDYRHWLVLRDTSWKQSGSDVVVKGVLVNTAPRPFRGVEISFWGVDAAGYPVVSGGTSIPYVAGDDAVSFQFSTGCVNVVERGEVAVVQGRLDP